MPYINLKVSQDLFEELGLSSNMELVRSGGSVKFIPLCNERVSGYYKSPLLTSPMFENHPSVEKGSSKTVPNDFPCEPVLNIGAFPSVSVPVSKKCKISEESADSDSSLSAEQASDFSKDITRCYADKPFDDSPQNNASKRGNQSGAIHFENRPDLNQFGSFEDSGSNLDAFNDFNMFLDEESEVVDDTARSLVQQVCPTESPVAAPPENPFDFRLPSTSEPSTSISSTTSSRFGIDNVSSIQLDSRGRLSSVTLTTPQLSSAPAVVKPPPTKNEVTRCDKCFSVFKRRSYYRRHHRKICDQLMEKKLKLAGVRPDCDRETLESVLTRKITYPRICEKCGLIFEDSSGFRSHRKRCERYSKRQTISSRTEKIILPSCSDSMSMVSSTVDKYIPLKEEPKSGPRFFVRKKAPTDANK